MTERPNRSPSTSRPIASVVSSTQASPYRRGMQPLPTDKWKLRKELTRLNFALHCLHGVRSKLAVLLDRKDAQLVQTRRQRDAVANALQDLDPELYAVAEQERRDMDNPRKAIEWSMRTGETDDVL